jgi:heme/copper-type cytochrome/quinol oxidase subunit 3
MFTLFSFKASGSTTPDRTMGGGYYSLDISISNVLLHSHIVAFADFVLTFIRSPARGAQRRPRVRTVGATQGQIRQEGPVMKSNALAVAISLLLTGILVFSTAVITAALCQQVTAGIDRFQTAPWHMTQAAGDQK